MKNSLKNYIFSNHVLLTVLLLIFGWFLLQVKGILIEVFIAYIIMAAFTPFIRALREYKIPNSIATAITYVLALTILVVIIFPLVPFFASQIQSLVKTFPLYIKDIANLLGINFNVNQLQTVVTSDLGTISENAYTITKNIFSGIFSALAVFVISVYLSLDRSGVHTWVTGLFPKDSQDKAGKIIREIEEKLGAWVRGQIVLSFSIAAVTWLALTLLHIPFALPLAMIAGILEIVPTLGPIISAIPAMIVALSISPTLMIVVALSYVCIQFLENHLLVPKIMQAAVGLNPVVIIVAVAIGAQTLGVVGALLAVPFLSAIIIFFKELQ
jgi:predicted PurR-regulated permease PerM